MHRSNRTLSLAAFALVTSFAASAAASEPPTDAMSSSAPETVVPVVPIVVETLANAEPIVDRAALHRAIQEELRQPVVVGNAPAGAPRLVVTFGSDGTLAVTFRDAAGHEIARTVSRPNDPNATIQLIALLAGNLARNEAGDLEAELRVREEPAPPIAPPVVVVLAPVTVPSLATPRRDGGEPAIVRGIDTFHAGRLSLRAGGAGGFTASGYPHVGGSAAIGYRAGRYFAIEAGGGAATFPWSWFAFGTVAAMARFEVNRFEFALGGGPTALVMNSGNVFVGASSLARVTMALAGPVDLYAQADIAAVIDPARTFAIDAVASFGGGLQARLLP